MAISTVTLVTQEGGAPEHPQFLTRVSFTGPASYATGGETGLQAALQAQTKDQRSVFTIIPEKTAGYKLEWDAANSKVMIYQGNNDAGADGPAVEVPNATDLSGVTFFVVVLGS